MADTWTCPNCLTDWSEPECDGCGRNLAETHDIVSRIDEKAVAAAEHVWGEHHPLTEAMRATRARLVEQRAGYEDDGEFSRAVSVPFRQSPEEQMRETVNYELAREFKW